MSFLGSALGGLAGFALAPFTGGSSLLMTGLGAGLGSAATGGSLKEDIAAGTLGALGAGYLPGLFGAEAAGGLGLAAPTTSGLAEMGGAGGLTLGGVGEGGAFGGLGSGIGAGLTDYGLGAGGLGAADYSLGSAGAGGLGLSGDALAGYTGPGTGGSYLDQLRRQFAGLGFGGGGAGGAGGGMPSGLRTALGGMQLLGGLQQFQTASQRQAQQQGYAQQLQRLMANPGSVESLPGYQAGLRAVQRKARAEGFGGSGSMAAALAGYGGQQYQQQLSNLAALQGGSAPIASPMAALTNVGAGLYGLGAF